MTSSVWQRYFLPGFVFQGITIGGGYATGRELIEFFGPAGPAGGLLGMVVTMVVYSIVLAASFEFARATRSYDYKSFFSNLLGPGWVLFEVAYALLLVIVLAVIGAAAGEIAANTFGLPAVAGSLALVGMIGVLVFFGSGLVERSTAGIAVMLYACYVTLVAWTIARFGGRVDASFAASPAGSGWALGGLTYAGYNLATLVGVLICVRHLRTRRDALVAGALTGPIAMMPGVLFFVAMMAFYPDILEQTLPSAYVLRALDAPWFETTFQLVVFGALVATGTPLLHSINERVARVFEARSRSMPAALRPAISVGVMTVSVFAATAVGLVGLIAKGYGLLTWAFIILLVVPVLTIGAWRIFITADPGSTPSKEVPT